MKRTSLALLLVLTVAITACSNTTSPPSTFGVDGAPQPIKDTFLMLTRQAATLAGYDATNEQWMEFADEVCASELQSPDELSEFVDQKAGATADASTRQMWTTAATAATTSFCPIR